MKNSYEIRGDVTAIFLKKKDGTILETFISTSDLEKVKSLNVRWYADWNKLINGYYCTAHTYRNYQHKKIYLHRFLTDCPIGMQVDHIDCCTLNNIRQNLRNITQTENQQNRAGAYKNNKTGIRGVCFDKNRGKWIVQMQVNKQRYFFGPFDTAEEAGEVAKEARTRLMPFSREAGA